MESSSPSETQELPKPWVNREPSLALLGHAWRAVTMKLGTFVAIGSIDLLLVVLIIAAQTGIESALGFPENYADYESSHFLITHLMSAMTNCLIYMPFSAATMLVIYKVLEHDPDVFSGYRAFSKHYFSVFLFGLIVAAVMIPVYFAVRAVTPPGAYEYIETFLSALLYVPFLLVIPAMVRFDMSLLEALRYSFDRVTSRPLAYIGYSMLAFVMTMIGVLACVVGLIFTMQIERVAIALLMPPRKTDQPASHTNYPPDTNQSRF